MNERPLRARTVMRLPRRVWLGALGSIAAEILGCAPSGSPRAPKRASYPGALVNVATVPEDFLWRQQIVMRYAGLTHSFDAVVQKRGPKLTVLGLTPFGTRAFLIEQRATRLSSQNFGSRALPFEPRSVLLDFHRVFLIRLTPGKHSGHVSAMVSGERVCERWQDGRLFQRRFSRPETFPGSITVNYPGGMVFPTPSPTIRLKNGWFDYQLEIKTLQAERL